jgi:hypothetical protein
VEAKHSKSVRDRNRLESGIRGSSPGFECKRFGLSEVTFQKRQAPGRFRHCHDLLSGIGASRDELRSQRVPFCVRPVSTLPTDITQEVKTKPGMLNIAVGERLFGKHFQPSRRFFSIFRAPGSQTHFHQLDLKAHTLLLRQRFGMTQSAARKRQSFAVGIDTETVPARSD